MSCLESYVAPVLARFLLLRGLFLLGLLLRLLLLGGGLRWRLLAGPATGALGLLLLGNRNISAVTMAAPPGQSASGPAARHRRAERQAGRRAERAGRVRPLPIPGSAGRHQKTRRAA